MPVAMKDDRPGQPSTQSELAMRTQDTEATEQEPTVASLACHRKSPRPCINQTLVDELAVIRQWRFLQFGSASFAETLLVDGKTDKFLHLRAKQRMTRPTALATLPLSASSSVRPS